MERLPDYGALDPALDNTELERLRCRAGLGELYTQVESTVPTTDAHGCDLIDVKAAPITSPRDIWCKHHAAVETDVWMRCSSPIDCWSTENIAVHKGLRIFGREGGTPVGSLGLSFVAGLAIRLPLVLCPGHCKSACGSSLMADDSVMALEFLVGIYESIPNRVIVHYC